MVDKINEMVKKETLDALCAINFREYFEKL